MPDSTVLITADFAAALANTAPFIWRDGADHLPDLDTLRRLLVEHRLDREPLIESDVQRARDLRDRLRVPFDARSDAECAAAINDLLTELKPVARLDYNTHGWTVQLHCPSGLAIDNAMAAAAHALADLIATDGRTRLHHCVANDCQGIYVDTTRNRSRRFCMPEICGNRTNVAAHRRRSRST